MRILWHDALDVGVNDAIHRPVERLARLHPAIEEPSPRRLLLDLAIGRLPIPRYVPPKDRLVEWRGFPDGPRVNAVVEEHDERARQYRPTGNGWSQPFGRFI